MEDYKPNSNRFKEEQNEKVEEKKIEKVVTGKVLTKKRSKVNQFFDEIVSEDAKNVKSYVFGEVLIPAIKFDLLFSLAITFVLFIPFCDVLKYSYYLLNKDVNDDKKILFIKIINVIRKLCILMFIGLIIASIFIKI